MRAAAITLALLCHAASLHAACMDEEIAKSRRAVLENARRTCFHEKELLLQAVYCAMYESLLEDLRKTKKRVAK